MKLWRSLGSGQSTYDPTPRSAGALDNLLSWRVPKESRIHNRTFRATSCLTGEDSKRRAEGHRSGGRPHHAIFGNPSPLTTPWRFSRHRQSPRHGGRNEKAHQATTSRLSRGALEPAQDLHSDLLKTPHEDRASRGPSLVNGWRAVKLTCLGRQLSEHQPRHRCRWFIAARRMSDWRSGTDATPN